MACFDSDGNRVEPEGVCPAYETGNTWPTFTIVKPAIDNGKMGVFLSHVMFDVDRDGRGGRVSIPFGRQDCTAFRKVMSTENTIHEFAPTLRTGPRRRRSGSPYRRSGDLCGFGTNYFDLENVGDVKTATEMSADNSALMRNIRRHEHALEGGIRVTFDDSVLTDTTAEKRQDMDGVTAGLMEPWEYRAKRYGEDEATAKRVAAAGGSAAVSGGSSPSTQSREGCRCACAAARSSRRARRRDEKLPQGDGRRPLRRARKRRRSGRGGGRAPTLGVTPAAPVRATVAIRRAFRFPGLGGRNLLGAVASSGRVGDQERRSRVRDCRAKAQGRRRHGAALAVPR